VRHIEPLVPLAPNVSSDRRDTIVFHTDPVVWPESLLPPGEKLIPPRNEPAVSARTRQRRLGSRP
jgi:hypothetical protein